MMDASKTIKADLIDQQVMSIVRTVLERCKKEKSNNCLQVPLEDCYERVSYYTAMPKMLVYHVIGDNPYEEDRFDDSDHIILMECVNSFLSRQLTQRIKDLYEEFLKCRKLSSIETGYTPNLKSFERKIFNFGYKFKKNLKNPPLILIEDPSLKFYRYNFLSKLKSYRDRNVTIYYVAEKYILHAPFKDPVISYQIGKRKGDGLFYFHLISEDGYENGLFVSHDGGDSLENIFKKWMLDIVLYSIKPGSVIVMANNSIHGSFPKNSITRYHSKKQMLQWLRENDIPCDPNLRKPRLYELIEKCSFNNKDYDIDRVFKVHGQNVLRLPEHFPSLSPTKFLWDYINNPTILEIINTKDRNIECLRNNLLKFISNIEKSMWTQFFDRSRLIENRIFEIDILTEDLLENTCELDEKGFYDSTTYFNMNDFLVE